MLSDRLPPEIINEVQELVCVTEETATTTCYKQAKVRLLELFGPQEDEDFVKAAQLLLTTTPSQLARKQAELVCGGVTKMSACDGCSKVVSGLW